MKKPSWLSASLGGAEVAAGVVAGLVIGAVILVLVQPAAVVRLVTPKPQTVAVAPAPVRSLAVFGTETPSDDARYLAHWIAYSGDAAGAEFLIIDKKFARLFVFDADAKLRGAAPVLLGGAKGDDTVPGIGSRPIDKVLPAERTTPAGRFIGERGRNARGEDVVWVDYDAAVSIHRVLTINPGERRLERLATPTHEDNRISYGCINVPVPFYEAYVRPTFASKRAIIYVLPETRPVDQVFGSYDAVARLGNAGSTETVQAAKF